MAESPDYSNWSRDSLVNRIRELEAASKKQQTSPQNNKNETTPSSSSRNKGKAGTPDPSKYSTRFIALKFAYLGKGHGPFEYSPGTLQPSVEEELWKALTKTCLIIPKDPAVVDFAEFEYSKCGRTDVGVSSFGQVISLRVRSNRPLPREPVARGEADAGEEAVVSSPEDSSSDFDHVLDEIQYCKVLNRVLPDHIRFYAWCPAPPPNFSARFSCRERQYRYFFTQPAFSPMPSQLESTTPGPRVRSGWLDIDAMREAATRFEGEHDFRNFCRLDSSKIITDYRRKIYEATINEVTENHACVPFLDQADLQPANAQSGENWPKVYSFNVRGSGFLWHQIRHMVGILFLVGQGLEEPSVVSELLDVKNHPRRPNYTMADEAPLVLWDCLFPQEDGPEGKDALEWIHLGDEQPLNKYGPSGLVDALWSRYRDKKMDEILACQLLQRLATEGSLEKGLKRNSTRSASSRRLFEGGNTSRSGGGYVRVMKRAKLPSIEESHDRMAQKKGFANAGEMVARLREQKNVVVEMSDE